MNSSEDNSNSLTGDLNNLYYMIFNRSTVVFIIWCLALHFTCYWLLKYFFSNNIENLDYQSKLSRFLDIAILIFITVFLTASYYSTPAEDKETILENVAFTVKEYVTDSDSIYKTVVFILFLYCIVYLFHIPMNTQTKPYFIIGMEYGGWTTLMVIIFSKFFKDAFDIDMLDTIFSFFDWSNLPTNPKFSKPANVPSDKGGTPKPAAAAAAAVAAPKPAENKVAKKNTVDNVLASLLQFTTTSAPSTQNVPTATGGSSTTTTRGSNITATRRQKTTGTPTTTRGSNNTTTSGPNKTTTTGPNNTTTSGPNNTTTSGPNKTTTKSSEKMQNIQENFDTTSPNVSETTTGVPVAKIQELKEHEVKTTVPEVFNVTGGYTYDEAQLVCAAYGAKLANYDQIEESYNKGGEWCNYGWSDGQQALFPTQKSTWNKLQKSTDETIRQSCGRPGINGGYLAETTKKIGINCFGKKPELSDKDLLLKQQQQLQIFAKSKQEEELNNKIAYWKKQINDGNVKVNFYNHGLWSNYEGDIKPDFTAATTKPSGGDMPTGKYSLSATTQGPSSISTTSVPTATTLMSSGSTSAPASTMMSLGITSAPLATMMSSGTTSAPSATMGSGATMTPGSIMMSGITIAPDNSMMPATTMGSIPGTTMGSVPGTTMGSAPGTTMGSMQGTTMGSMQGTTMGSIMGSAPGTTMGSIMGSAPGTTMGSMQGTTMGSAPGTTMGSSPETTMGSVPGTTMGSAPGTTMGSIPGTTMGSVPGTTMGSVPGTTMGSVPGTTMGSVPGTTMGSVPGTTMGSLPGTTMGSVPGTTMGSVPGTTMGSVPGTTMGSVPSTTKGSVPGTTKGSVPGTTKGSVPGTTKGSVPSTTKNPSITTTKRR
jgi:hypothetical protein